MRFRWLSTAAVATILLGAFGAQSAHAGGAFDPYRFTALIDRDNNPNTGCEVNAEDDNFPGPVEGIEYIVDAAGQRFTETQPSSSTASMTADVVLRIRRPLRRR